MNGELLVNCFSSACVASRPVTRMMLSLLLALSSTASFDEWKRRHGVAYASRAEETARRIAFDANVAAVEERALGWESAMESPFADQTPDEFNVRNGYLAALRTSSRATSEHTVSGRTLPDAMDWRDHGLVTAVKNQGACGACWAFSTIASIEGQHAKAVGNLTSLSEENVIDCVKGVRRPGHLPCCHGCKGGLMDDAFYYLTHNESGGVDTELAYPYSKLHPPSGLKCTFKRTGVGATIGGYVDVPAGNESALLDAVATVGPISVAVDAGIGWQLYHRGILHPRLCSSKPGRMNHAVTVVGYGTDHGTDYWIIKNSYGAHYGEHGYVRLLRGKNACGVANAASYPNDIRLVEERV